VSSFRVLIAGALLTAALSVNSVAAADCSDPIFEMSESEVRPGDQVRISGHAWGDACNDTPGPGCNPPHLGQPIQDITFVLRNRTTGDSLEIATVDADENYGFELALTVPDIASGKYVVRDARKEAPGKRLRVLE